MVSDRLLKESDVIEAFKGREFLIHDVYTATAIIRSVPSADRPQGEWLKFGLGRGTRILFCTNCERRIEVPLSQGDSNYDFCPNCGARMKGADDDSGSID
jgi:hypothetical protein